MKTVVTLWKVVLCGKSINENRDISETIVKFRNALVVKMLSTMLSKNCINPYISVRLGYWCFQKRAKKDKSYRQFAADMRLKN